MIYGGIEQLSTPHGFVKDGGGNGYEEWADPYKHRGVKCNCCRI
jgi:hypothetical protein